MSYDHNPSKAIYRPGPDPSKVPVSYEGGSDQANRRMLVTYRDHHRFAKFPEGRCWWGYVEIPADPMLPPGAVGSLAPGHHEFPFGTREDPTWERWEAPWYPQEKYFDFDHRRSLVRIRYDKMIADYTQRNREYYAAANKIASGNGWEAPRMGGDLHPRYIDLLGQQPQSIKIPQAAQAGDPWLLGFSQEPNEQLAKLLRETTYGDWDGMAYEEALQIANGVATPLSSPAEVLSMNPDQLNALIAQAVADALARQATARKKKGPSPEHMDKMRQAAANKRASQAGASASA